LRDLLPVVAGLRGQNGARLGGLLMTLVVMAWPAEVVGGLAEFADAAFAELRNGVGELA
jgi:hypothetical protein